MSLPYQLTPGLLGSATVAEDAIFESRDFLVSARTRSLVFRARMTYGGSLQVERFGAGGGGWRPVSVTAVPQVPPAAEYTIQVLAPHPGDRYRVRILHAGVALGNSDDRVEVSAEMVA